MTMRTTLACWMTLFRLILLCHCWTTAATNNTLTYNLLPTTLTDQSFTIWSVAFHPDDSNLLASGSEFTAVHLWDLSSLPTVEFQVLEESFFDEVTYEVAFHNPYIAIGFSSCSTPGTIQVWDMQDADQPMLVNSFVAHTVDVWTLTFALNGEYLIAGSQDATISIWKTSDIANDQTDAIPPEPLGLLTEHTGTVFDVKVSPDGSQLASASIDGTIRLWGFVLEASGILLMLPNVETINQGSVVRTIAYSPDGSILVSAGDNGLVYVWNTTDYALVRELEHERFRVVYDLAFEPTGAAPHLASISRGALKIWNYLTGELVDTLSDSGNSVAYSLDGKRLAAGNSGEIKLWDINSPSTEPSARPTLRASNAPSFFPTTIPTPFPSEMPTEVELPSMFPTSISSNEPTSKLSTMPTMGKAATVNPSSGPPSSSSGGSATSGPTTKLSDLPTSVPSAIPTTSQVPSALPSRTSIPSLNPTSQVLPSISPTISPTFKGNLTFHTNSSSSVPTMSLVPSSSSLPSLSPTKSQLPTLRASHSPSSNPTQNNNDSTRTGAPTNRPSLAPSIPSVFTTPIPSVVPPAIPPAGDNIFQRSLAPSEFIPSVANDDEEDDDNSSSSQGYCRHVLGVWSCTIHGIIALVLAWAL